MQKLSTLWLLLICLCLSSYGRASETEVIPETTPLPVEKPILKRRPLSLVVGPTRWSISGDAFYQNGDGYGLNFEAGYEVLPRFALGLKTSLGLGFGSNSTSSLYLDININYLIAAMADYAIFDDVFYLRAGFLLGYLRTAFVPFFGLNFSSSLAYGSIAGGPRLIVGFRISSRVTLAIDVSLLFVPSGTGTLTDTSTPPIVSTTKVPSFHLLNFGPSAVIRF